MVNVQESRQVYLCDHVLGTEMHVSGDSGVLFENKAKSAEFY
jgi:hypothetical protein